MSLSQNNDPAAAANVFRDLVRRDPKFAEGHNNLGLVLLQSGEIHGAEASLQRRRGLSHATPKRITISPWCFDKKVRTKEAQHELERAYELEPELKSLPLP